MKYRNALNGDHPGSYQIATRAGKSTLNPGETLHFEQYITGYGNILTAKIQAYISTDAFVMDDSFIRSSITKKEVDGGTELGWGNTVMNPTDTGFTCVLAGMQLHESHESTMIFDVPGHPGTPILVCENKVNHAPFEYTLKTKKDIGPGEYYIDFYLTFFNGDHWITSKERVPFKVRNFFERHAKAISALAVIASASGIIRFAALPIYDFVKSFFC